MITYAVRISYHGPDGWPDGALELQLPLDDALHADVALALALVYDPGSDEADAGEAEEPPFWFGVSIGRPHFFKQLRTPKATLAGSSESNSAMLSPLRVVTPKSACTTSSGSSKSV